MPRDAWKRTRSASGDSWPLLLPARAPAGPARKNCRSSSVSPPPSSCPAAAPVPGGASALPQPTMAATLNDLTSRCKDRHAGALTLATMTACQRTTRMGARRHRTPPQEVSTVTDDVPSASASAVALKRDLLARFGGPDGVQSVGVSGSALRVVLKHPDPRLEDSVRRAYRGTVHFSYGSFSYSPSTPWIETAEAEREAQTETETD